MWVYSETIENDHNVKRATAHTHTRKEKESPQMNDNQQNVCDSFESTLKSSRYFSTLKPQDK